MQSPPQKGRQPLHNQLVSSATSSLLVQSRALLSEPGNVCPRDVRLAGAFVAGQQCC